MRAKPIGAYPKLQRGGRYINGEREQLYSKALADEICDRLATGESLRAICRIPGMPSEMAVRKWVKNRPDTFGSQYARAREVGYDSLADALLDIENDEYLGPDGFVDNGAIQRARLISENRKWVLSKVLPKRYGDKVIQEITGDPDAPLVTRIELVPVTPVLRALPKRRDDAAD